MRKTHITLFPLRLCETLNGNLAYTVGRVMFKPGRPMLVEHLGGLYLEHDLFGRVVTPGYHQGYDITYVQPEERAKIA
ncbi:MAG: hypothetical protein OXT65_11345 [Alphaproteobacteria bacterium]|nr:hypothetical protein [Alphaproteobacteria bacterium]